MSKTIVREPTQTAALSSKRFDAGARLFFAWIAVLSNRSHLVEDFKKRGIKDQNVLRAMKDVPRHLFVPEEYQDEAYADHPLPIGYGQTISQPYIVALMSELLCAKPGMKVLEIGAGSGYQTAVLLEMGLEVFAIERLPELFESAKGNLKRAGYKSNSLHLVCSDGTRGWPLNLDGTHRGKKMQAWNFQGRPKHGFDRILLAAAPEELPSALLHELCEGGRMIAPIGGRHSTQRLEAFRKEGGQLHSELITLVRFVPLICDRQ